MNEILTMGSIHRAKAVLDVLANAPLGASLSQVIAQTDFTKTTSHRTLQSLQSVHFVYQEPDTRRYFLGAAMAKLARSASLSSTASLSGRAMQRLAKVSEDTVFLSIPEGAVSICARVELGAFPIRTLTLEAGTRVPLGVGATGQALYAATPKAKRQAAAQANEAWMADFNYTPAQAEELAADFETRGYALNPSIPVPGMSAIALPIKSATGRTFAALGFG
ncbi:MAG: IclR family transcriptional regulator, partial [Sedimentitalea sp.]